MILEKINKIKDMRRLNSDELAELAIEVRDYIIEVISHNGGHLASSLGVVDLTIALHYAFNTPHDRLIWDVGHQTYAHKILTGRRDAFPTIRQYGGISGFPKMNESEFDTFDVGHSSTSLSLALGCAVSRDIERKKNKVIAVIGDGSLTGGMALEALNHMGHVDNDIIIILNDNEHSISKNVGGISRYLTRIISGSLYNKFRLRSMRLVRMIPKIGAGLYSFLYRFFHIFKGMIIPGQFFEDMGIRYFGPVDGHNIEEMISIFRSLKGINSGPKIVHVITQKGRGYIPAEMNPSRFHGIGPFDRATGIELDRRSSKSYSDIAGETLAHLAKNDRKIVAVTAAMKLGTGLSEFEVCAPRRFFDVGIAEQHAITFAGALASNGMRPFVSIYSTFLQRAVDQLIHDIGLMKLPLRILVDRAGIVGNDGETHHGLFDIAIIKNIPNFIILAPSDGEELRDMIYFAASYDKGPVAIRYPRGSEGDRSTDVTRHNPFNLQKVHVLTRGRDIAIFTFGDMVPAALEAGRILREKSISTAVVNLLTIKPLDVHGIDRVLKGVRYFITLENGIISGGAGEYLLSKINAKYREKLLFTAGFPDEFIPHGSVDRLFARYGIDASSLSQRILKAVR